MPKILDLTGRAFGKLKVLQINSQRNKRGKVMWDCVCECGNRTTKEGGLLKKGSVKSCGCIVIRPNYQAAKCGVSKTTNAISSHPLYNTYRHMIDRCHNPKSDKFKWYGQRGIEVCREWRNDFWRFVEDMGLPPGTGYTIDRQNPNSGYSKENCNWATKQQQSRNRSHIVLYDYQGDKYTLTELCKKLGISLKRTQSRIKRGWTLEDALSPENRKNQHC